MPAANTLSGSSELQLRIRARSDRAAAWLGLPLAAVRPWGALVGADRSWPPTVVHGGDWFHDPTVDHTGGGRAAQSAPSDLRPLHKPAPGGQSAGCRQCVRPPQCACSTPVSIKPRWEPAASPSGCRSPGAGRAWRAFGFPWPHHHIISEVVRPKHGHHITSALKGPDQAATGRRRSAGGRLAMRSTTPTIGLHPFRSGW